MCSVFASATGSRTRNRVLPGTDSTAMSPWCFFTTKPVGEGTGLGLDISWRIVVNKHHGDIELESSPGDTRFRVRLPVTAQEES